MPPDSTGDVQVQILNWNRGEDTCACIRSVLEQEGPRPCVVVVDNGSVDGSPERIIAQFPDVELLRASVNEGFSGGHNRAFRHGLEKGRRLFVLVNNDAVLAEGALQALVAAAEENPSRGVLGAWVLQDSREPRLETRGVRLSPRTGRMVHLGFGKRPQDHAALEDVAAVSGCAMLVRREVLARVGLFNEEYFAYFEDLDLCVRAARAGYRVASVPSARVVHRGKASAGGPSSPQWVYYAVRNHLLFLARNFPLGSRALEGLRSLWVIALNLAHVVLASPVHAAEGARAVAAGALAFHRHEFGVRK